MKTVGIIAEYNPFHNGHAYQIAQAKEKTGADYCIIVMSGNFTQRGIPAIMDKSFRTRAALTCGADLVIELPVSYATASAEYFAMGAVSLLDRLGVVNSICFGSECGNLEALHALSDTLLSENSAFKACLKTYIKEGYSYPQARNHALSDTCPQLGSDLSLLQAPNNILGIEYLNALKKRKSSIKAYTIPRAGADYHDNTLHTAYSSALAIREVLAQGNILSLKKQIPPAVYEWMKADCQKTFPVLPDDMASLLLYKLSMEQEHGYSAYFDIDSCLSDRIRKHLFSYTGFTSFCLALKSKNMTYARISRNLLHILLNIYQTDVDAFCSEDYVYYARVLGLKKESAPLLSAVKANSSIPLISKLSGGVRMISPEHGRKMLSQDIRAGHVYDIIAHQKFRLPLKHEYQKQIVTL